MMKKYLTFQAFRHGLKLLEWRNQSPSRMDDQRQSTHQLAVEEDGRKELAHLCLHGNPGNEKKKTVNN